MKAQASIADIYDKVASWYDLWEWQSFWDKNEIPLVRTELSRLGWPARAIDLGSGTGRYVSEFRSCGVDAFAIDVSREMVSIAAKKLGGEDRLVLGDLRSETSALGKFQLAIAARVFCHIENVTEAFSAASHLVEQGGHLFVTELDIKHEFERTRIPTPAGKVSIDTWKRSAGELVEAAESSGWRFEQMIQTTASECLWLPGESKISSIDRCGARPIFNLLTFSRM